MVDLGPHLRIDGQTAVEFVAGFGKEAHGEFALKHEDADTRGRGQGEKFECQRGRNLERKLKKALIIAIARD